MIAGTKVINSGTVTSARLNAFLIIGARRFRVRYRGQACELTIDRPWAARPAAPPNSTSTLFLLSYWDCGLRQACDFARHYAFVGWLEVV
ncbi:MAG: hypothetical protein V3U93_06285 [Alphaproteobacteria bacterium]